MGSSLDSVNGYTIYQLDGIDDSVNIDGNGLNDFDASLLLVQQLHSKHWCADIATHLNIRVCTRPMGLESII